MPKQHTSGSAKTMLKQLKKSGFEVSSKNKSGTIRITPPKGKTGPIYHTHATESSTHAMRRDFKRLYNVDLE